MPMRQLFHIPAHVIFSCDVYIGISAISVTNKGMAFVKNTHILSEEDLDQEGSVGGGGLIDPPTYIR